MFINNRGSVLIGAMVVAISVAVMAGVVSTQFRTTETASEPPRIRSNMLIAEIQLRNFAINPEAYENCNSDIGPSTCVLRRSALDKFEADRRNLRISIAGSMYDPSRQTFVGVINASKTTGLKIAPRNFEVRVPDEVLQEADMLCTNPAAPFFDGFHPTTGVKRCKALPITQCSTGFFVASINPLTLAPDCQPAGDNVACGSSANPLTYISNLSWAGGPTVSRTCAARQPPSVPDIPCRDGACVNPPPAQCPGASRTWVSGGRQCVGYIPATLAGYTGNAVDSSADPYLGSATYACNSAGVWVTTPINSSCAPNPCPGGTLSWSQGSSNCSASVGATNPFSSAGLSDNTGPHIGSASATCQASGEWGPVSGNCRVGTCPSTSVNWRDPLSGQICTASVPSINSLTSVTVNDTTGNPTGYATLACQGDLTWAAPTGAVCNFLVPPSPGACSDPGDFYYGPLYMGDCTANAACPAGSNVVSCYQQTCCNTPPPPPTPVPLVYGGRYCADTGYAPGTECSTTSPGCVLGNPCSGECVSDIQVVGGQCAIYHLQCAPTGTHPVRSPVDPVLCGGGPPPTPTPTPRPPGPPDPCAAAMGAYGPGDCSSNGQVIATSGSSCCAEQPPNGFFPGEIYCSGSPGNFSIRHRATHANWGQFICEQFEPTGGHLPSSCWGGNSACAGPFGDQWSCDACQHDNGYPGTCSQIACF